MSPQKQEELSFKNENIICDSKDNTEVIDATDDFQLGVSYVHTVHWDK